jgi:hypothetical protein
MRGALPPRPESERSACLCGQRVLRRWRKARIFLMRDVPATAARSAAPNACSFSSGVSTSPTAISSKSRFSLAALPQSVATDVQEWVGDYGIRPCQVAERLSRRRPDRQENAAWRSLQQMRTLPSTRSGGDPDCERNGRAVAGGAVPMQPLRLVRAASATAFSKRV